MAEKILLSTYIVKILDDKKNKQILNHFNGSSDFLTVFSNFCTQIFETIYNHQSLPDKPSMYLTLSKPAILKQKERAIYGFFSSGISGENFKIRNIRTNKLAFEVDGNNHGSFRDVFFYLNIPKEKNVGYLIIQRKANFGVKGNLTASFNKYFKENGFMMHQVHFNNFLDNKVYSKMLEFGKLNKINFVKHTLPNTLEELYNNNQSSIEQKGKLITTLSSSTGLSIYWKKFVNSFFERESLQSRIEIIEDREVDEIEFELELNKKKKTFYIKNKKRTQPDIDVTANIILENGVPTESSLVLEAEDLINDMKIGISI